MRDLEASSRRAVADDLGCANALIGAKNGALREVGSRTGRTPLSLFRWHAIRRWNGNPRCVWVCDGETTEGGWRGRRVASACAPRSFDRLLSGKASVTETGSSAAEMLGNLDHRLVVAFRLRTRRPGVRMDK